MRQRFSKATLLCIAAVLTIGSELRAAADAKPPKFDSPAQALSAAEDAFGHHDYGTYFDCFSAGGQKGVVSFLVMAAQDTDQPPTATQAEQKKKMTALLAKFGVTDFTKHPGDTDDQATDRLVSQIKDRRGFASEMIALLLPASEVPAPIKGKLQGLKTTGEAAHATYATKTADGTEMTQDIDFEKDDGSWRIGTFIFFSSPAN
jgi:hypothetical protein